MNHAFAPEALRKLPYGMQDLIGDDIASIRYRERSSAYQLARYTRKVIIRWGYQLFPFCFGAFGEFQTLA